MINKECHHTKIKIEQHEREFQNEKFSYKASTCKSCGAVLWDDQIEKKYNSWLDFLHSKKRHLFQVQFLLTEYALKCIEKLNERFPGVDESLLIRAIVMVYLDIVDGEDEITEKIEEYIETSDYLYLAEGDRKSKKVQFKPNGMRDILAYAEMFDLKPSRVIEESIYRILLLSIKEDEEMKSFWNKIILRNIETILKAA